MTAPSAIPASADRTSIRPRQLRIPRTKGVLESVETMRAEIQGYTDVLMGRVPAPIDNGVMTLMEVANAYYSRALEITMAIHAGERDDKIEKGSPLYRFRTGELRDFTELCKGASELGSRRLTDAIREAEMRHG